MLSNLLRKLQDQITENIFTYSVVVVDNDAKQSAREIIKDWQKESVIQIDYHCEPEQNIALARNKAVENATGNYVAFIDDDEFPVKEWLLSLYRTLHLYKVDGVFGPVRPSYNSQTPQWLIKSGLCERPPNKTGKILSFNDTLRTGNVLVHRRVFNTNNNLFEKRFGRTGGEDAEFFEKRVMEGYTFVWCEEAVVYENVPPERSKFSFYLIKGIRIGSLTGEKMRKGVESFWRGFIISACISLFYIFIIPLFIFNGKHTLARNIVRYVYHVSRFLASIGIVLIRERQFDS